MAWYDTGTVSVTNGSTAVTGSGTNFVAGAQVGEGFYGPDGRLYEIQAIVSATSLTLADAYLGSTQSGQTYKIVPTQSLTADLASQVSTLISDYQSVADNAGEGKFQDGSATSPGITFTQDQDTGFFRDTANEIAVAVAGVKIGEFNSSGLNMTTSIVADGGITFGDNDKAIFGAGSDLQIFHDGDHSFVRDAGTGHLKLQGSNLKLQDDSGNNYVDCIEGSYVQLTHNANPKLTTTSTGVDVTGTITSDGLTVDGTATVNSNTFEVSSTTPSIRLTETDVTDENTQILHATGSLRIRTASDDYSTATERMRIDHGTGDISFYDDQGSSQSFFWDASAETLYLGTTTGAGANQKLYVDGDIVITTGDSLVFGDGDAAITGYSSSLFYYDANTHRFRSSGGSSTHMIIDNDGNVGIGTDSPSATLDVAGDGTFQTAGGSILSVRNTGTSASAGTIFGELRFESDDSSRTEVIRNSIVSESLGTAANSDMHFRSANDDTLLDRMTIAYNGDISFYEDTGTTAKFFWDASAESLGIGTDSPAYKLDINGGADNTILRLLSTDDTCGIILTDNDSSSTITHQNGDLIFNADSGNADPASSKMVFQVDATEAARITEDGELLVGKTTKFISTVGTTLFGDGMAYHTVDDDVTMRLNRLTDDGDIVEFRIDSSVVGSIGARSDDIYMASGSFGIRIRTALDAVIPTDGSGTTSSDGTLILGNSSNRFKDLYLSGGVYLGGTGSANLLDDYEEGTFTPVVADAASGGNEGSALRAYGYYTKVGRWVNIVIELTNIDTTGLTGTNDLKITGLPFAADSVTGAVVWQGTVQVAVVSLNATTPYITATISEGQDVVYILEWGDNTGTDNLLVNQLTSGASDIKITMGYQTS